MKKSITIGIILIFTAIETGYSANGPEANKIVDIREKIAWFLGEDTAATQEVSNQFIDYIALFQSNKKDPEKQAYLIRKIFFKSQRLFLRAYENYVTLGELFGPKGKFDCVTGTALYALMLDALDIDYSIKETDFHVYLLVHLEDRDILLESTDPVDGFIIDGEEIMFRKKLYRLSPENGRIDESNIDGLKYLMCIDRKITLKQLAGLQYFNLAAKSFNNGDMENALHHLDYASMLYNSNRINDLKEIITLQVSDEISMRE